MLTPSAFAAVVAVPRTLETRTLETRTLETRTLETRTLETIEARLAVLDALLARREAPTLVVHVQLEPHPYAFGSPMSCAVGWEAFGRAVLGTSTALPNDSRWTKGGAK